jgi:hypothetical protein
MEHDEFNRAYRRGLAAFIEALRRADFADEVAFKSALKHALDSFGMTATSLAERVGHSKGTISKWINTDAMPGRPTREVVMQWIQDKAIEQLEELERHEEPQEVLQ